MSEAKDSKNNKIMNKSFYNDISVTINVNKHTNGQTELLIEKVKFVNRYGTSRW